MENKNLKNDVKVNNSMLSIVVHSHPIVEMQIKNIKKDDVGYNSECVLYNKDTNTIESSFLLDEDRANDIIKLMQSFLNNCSNQI